MDYLLVIRHSLQQSIRQARLAMASSSSQYYRRSLPATCVAFGSREGKQIFREAMNGNHMNCYFNLAAQFRTQDEPAYCGLSTLVMVLNALSVDPGRVWKEPWRWYHENMLASCVPIKVAAERGITLFQFSCIAKCNGLDVDVVRASGLASLRDFRNVIKRITQCDNRVLVCSYSRLFLGQTGDGHFSPIGGYHADRDMVLIFDVARFKYPPHWIQVEMLWKAMQIVDKVTAQPRGYMILKQANHNASPTVLFKVSNNFDFTLSSQHKPELLALLQNWWRWLQTSCHTNHEKSEYFRMLISKFVDLWCSKNISDPDLLLIVKIGAKCSEDEGCAVCRFFRSVEKQFLFHIVEDYLRSSKYGIADNWKNLVNICPINHQSCCSGTKSTSRSKLAHFATVILLSWPYETVVKEDGTELTHAVLSSKYIGQEITGADHMLQSEVALLKNHLAAILSHNHVGCLNQNEINKIGSKPSLIPSWMRALFSISKR